jgi:two-component system, NarL family, sensor histidine kinase DegS
MNVNFEREVKEGINRFTRLGTWYVLALSVIATVSVIGQLLIQKHLSNQRSDSRVVNVAGKQRMLSQKIAKSLLMLSQDDDVTRRTELYMGLRSSVRLWGLSQQGLLEGNDSLHLTGQNSAEITRLFDNIRPHFDAMYSNATAVVKILKHNPGIAYDSIKPQVTQVLANETSFLTGMERIVFQYDDEAHEKVTYLSRMEYLLLIVSLLVIILEIVFIFRPTTLHVNETIGKLIDSEKNAKKLSKEIGALYASLEKSYEQISHINEPVENPRLFAKADRGGNILFISQLFTSMTGVATVTPGMRIADLFENNDAASDWMDELIEEITEDRHVQTQQRLKSLRGQELWAELMVSPVYNDRQEIEELLILGSDITQQKQAEQNMSVKAKAEIEKKINQQKFRSVLILEGQEEERKRLAMDIHDGIGQMLTSLKFQIESINLDNGTQADQKIGEIQQLINQVIKEVRRVTFNLKPTVLGDYGLQAGLNVFIKEIGKLTDIQLEYRVEGDSDTRLPQKIENNVFRIVQEAINNAIKYSGANHIGVVLHQSEGEVVITVKDEGKGFDEKLVEARSTNIESGRGFFNMYERTEYINGRLDLRSSPGQGTTITLTIPLRAAVSV